NMSVYDFTAESWILIGEFFDPTGYVVHFPWSPPSEGVYLVSATAVNAYNMVGSDIVHVEIDNTPPVVASFIADMCDSTYTPGKNIVSKGAQYTLTISESNGLRPVTIRLRDASTMEIIDSFRLPTGVTVGSTTMITFSLEANWTAYAGRTALRLDVSALDLAGNEATSTSLIVHKDTTTSVSFTGAMNSASPSLSYGGSISGVVTDSFGYPIKSENVDIMIDGLFYAHARTDTGGSFSVTLDTLDTWTANLLEYMDPVSIQGASPNMVSILAHDVSLEEARTGGITTTKAYLMQKAFYSDATFSDVARINIDMTPGLFQLMLGSSPSALDAIAFDIVIPNLVSSFWQSTLFEYITVEFTDDLGYTFPFTFSRQALYDAFMDGNIDPYSQSFTYGMATLHRLRLVVPIDELSTVNPEAPFEFDHLASISLSAKPFKQYIGDLELAIRLGLVDYWFGVMGLYGGKVLTGSTFTIDASVSGHLFESTRDAMTLFEDDLIEITGIGEEIHSIAQTSGVLELTFKARSTSANGLAAGFMIAQGAPHSAVRADNGKWVAYPGTWPWVDTGVACVADREYSITIITDLVGGTWQLWIDEAFIGTYNNPLGITSVESFGFWNVYPTTSYISDVLLTSRGMVVTLVEETFTFSDPSELDRFWLNPSKQPGGRVEVTGGFLHVEGGNSPLLSPGIHSSLDNTYVSLIHVNDAFSQPTHVEFKLRSEHEVRAVASLVAGSRSDDSMISSLSTLTSVKLWEEWTIFAHDTLVTKYGKDCWYTFSFDIDWPANTISITMSNSTFSYSSIVSFQQAISDPVGFGIEMHTSYFHWEDGIYHLDYAEFDVDDVVIEGYGLTKETTIAAIPV
nr:hypothetical protein [Candidatus Sigynarchaeota archaeon]